MKIPNNEADIDLLKKRKKNLKFFNYFHLMLYFVFFAIIIVSFVTVLQASLIKEPTLHLTTLIAGLGVGVIFLTIFFLKEYISMLDVDRDIKYYEMFIYLKEKLEGKK